MSNLYFLMGLPRSSKSTFANEWRKKENRVIVCGDKIRTSLYGQRYCPVGETLVFATLHVMTRTLLDSGYEVLVDETNSSRTSIRRLLEIRIDAKPIPIITPPEICKQRAIECGTPDLIPAISRMNKNLVLALGEEYWLKPNVNELVEAYVDSVRQEVLDDEKLMRQQE